MKILTATKFKLAASALVVAGATTALVVQHQTQVNLRSDNAALTQHLAQLQADNEGLSNRIATAGDAKSLSDDKMIELLKLRGEVGVLRRQVSELGKLQEQNQVLRNEVLAAHQEQIQLPTKGQYEWHQTNTVNAARFVLLGMIIFSGDNHDRFPTNFSQISTLTEGMTNQTSGIGTEAFELLTAGTANNQESFKQIVIREQAPFQTTDGKWARTYGFADGHVEVPISVDGNFADWENQHRVPPPHQ